MSEDNNKEKEEFPDLFDHIPDILHNMKDYSELKDYLINYINMIKQEYIISKTMQEEETFRKISFLINIIVLNQYNLNIEDYNALMNKTPTEYEVLKNYIYDGENDLYYIKGYKELLNQIIDLGISYEKLTENIDYWGHEVVYIWNLEDILKRLYEKKEQTSKIIKIKKK